MGRPGCLHVFVFCLLLLPFCGDLFFFLWVKPPRRAVLHATVSCQPSAFPAGLPSCGGLVSSCSHTQRTETSSQPGCRERSATAPLIRRVVGLKGQINDLCNQMSTGYISHNSWEHVEEEITNTRLPKRLLLWDIRALKGRVWWCCKFILCNDTMDDFSRTNYFKIKHQ